MYNCSKLYFTQLIIEEYERLIYYSEIQATRTLRNYVVDWGNPVDEVGSVPCGCKH